MPELTERYPATGCVLRDKAKCKLPWVTCCDEGRAKRWPPAAERAHRVIGVPREERA